MTTDFVPGKNWLRHAGQVSIGLLWLWSGFSKAVDLDSFHQTLVAHGILPSAIIDSASVIVAIEIALGFVLLAAGDHRILLNGSLVLSLSLVVAFVVYLASVPQATLKATGCGCMGRWEPAPSSFAWWPFVRLGILALLHVPAWAHHRIRPASLPA